jgi:tRNA (guanosine-2'-O-)-methyltransferase
MLAFESQFDQRLLDLFLQFLTDNRRSKFEEVLKYRTRHITVVMEDIYQSQNASAVLRTCDLTGIQEVNIIENKYQYEVNPDVALGSSKWLYLKKFNKSKHNTIDAIDYLQNSGYKIVATSPHLQNHSPESINLESPIALFFGTEKHGLSQEVIERADTFIRIPMYGFTESYNISVSAALLLYTLTQRLHKSEISWQLTESDHKHLLLDWCRKSVQGADLIERDFYRLNKRYPD